MKSLKKSLKVNGQQLDLFAQDFSAAPAPEASPSADAAPSSLSALSFPPPFYPPAPPRVSPPPVPHKPSATPEPEPNGRAPDSAPLRQLRLGEHMLEYALRRSTRRSIGFMIDDEGLRVTAPRRVTLAEIDNAIRAKQGWILSKLHERRERRAQRLERPPVVWIDGAALPYLGGEIVLRLHQAARHRASFNPHTNELHVWLTPLSTEQQLKEKVRAWMQQEARGLFEQRLDLYAQKLGEPYHSFALSSAGTRWGSCTIERKIRLNWRLVQFPLPLIDYVVAHELSHLREMNHSARFWATVESIYPDYEGAKQALRKRAQELPVLFT
jgi:predicted metal-dependent hydrolase